MADTYLNFDGAMRLAKKVKTYVKEYAYDKAEVDNKIAEVESNITWKPAVATYDEISVKYPYPDLGWTVSCLDTNLAWRFNGDEWVEVLGVTPLATTEVDGLMQKEYVEQLDNLGSASTLQYTDVVGENGLPTGAAVQTYVEQETNALERKINKTLDQKLNTEDLGQAGYKGYSEELSEVSEQFLLSGDYYSSDVEDQYFVLSGLGGGGGVDFSYVEDMKSYKVSFNQIDYKSAITMRIHIVGYKGDELIDKYLSDGAIVSVFDMPDSYLSGDESGELQILIKDYDYEAGNISEIETLFNPIIIDMSNYEEHQMIDVEIYQDAPIDVHSSEKDGTIYTTYVVYGQYSDQSLPTGTAVSLLVGGIKQDLENSIEVLSDAINDIQGATEEDIDSLFDF